MIAAVLAGWALLQAPSEAVYAKFRSDREASLKREGGWLTVAGLDWLKEGSNAVGSVAGAEVRLPARAPSLVGTLHRTGRQVKFRAAEGVAVLINGEPATEATVKSDGDGRADRLKVGDLTFFVIVRGERVGVRLIDPSAPSVTGFQGLSWFGVNPSLRVAARFIPHVPARKIPITNVLGDVSQEDNPGVVAFSLGGKWFRLEAQGSLEGLFLNFADATNGRSTYGAGRFLNTGPVVKGWVMVDFNFATHPPCAYTEFATCPLPPPGNRLPIPIEAGERLPPNR